MSDNVDIITGIGLLPVVILDDPDQAAPLAEALLAGGLAATEVTFRTPAAARGIEIMSGHPELFVAAGTVRTLDQLDAALAAGARMIVSPGLSESVVAAALEAGVPVAPGVATATEVQRAADLGLDLVKFFPAATSGGAAAIKALSSPFAEMRFIPTGGITTDSLADYAALPCVAAVGGSWMVAPSLLRAGDFAAVTSQAQEAVDAVARARSGERSA